jgi:hypothetical protein
MMVTDDEVGYIAELIRDFYATVAA